MVTPRVVESHALLHAAEEDWARAWPDLEDEWNRAEIAQPTMYQAALEYEHSQAVRP
jgi:hypothetical protein